MNCMVSQVWLHAARRPYSRDAGAGEQRDARLRAIAHERFYDAAMKKTRRPIISWLCARTIKETLNSYDLLRFES
jgi:hypothetical protein